MGDIFGALKRGSVWQLVNNTTFRFFSLRGRAITPDSSMLRICFGAAHFERASITLLEERAKFSDIRALLGVSLVLAVLA
jgi:hypothetical protein